MYRLINNNETRVADATAIGVNALATWTWIDDVNSILQLVLTIAGIVAAVAAARYHILKTNKLKDDNQP